MINQESGPKVRDHSEQEEQLSHLQNFKRQMLRAWQPIPSLSKTIILFLVLAIIFLSLGIPLIILSQSIIDYRIQYDNLCDINQLNCSVSFVISETLNAPVFAYYEITNFYQNHRLYASSVSNKQLTGQILTVSQISKDCTPIITNSDLYVTQAIDGTPLDPDAPANPCGLIAYTIFNDTFSLFLNDLPILFSTENIAWPSDIKRYSISNSSVMWYNTTDPRFMNWMRIAPLPNFRKLWGRINSNIVPGNYTLLIDNSKSWIMLGYKMTDFNGSKYFVLSTSNFFGSKNQFLSIIYLALGVICALIAFLFTIKKMRKKPKTI